MLSLVDNLAEKLYNYWTKPKVVAKPVTLPIKEIQDNNWLEILTKRVNPYEIGTCIKRQVLDNLQFKVYEYGFIVSSENNYVIDSYKVTYELKDGWFTGAKRVEKQTKVLEKFQINQYSIIEKDNFLDGIKVGEKQ